MANAQFLLEAASPKYGTWSNIPYVLMESHAMNLKNDLSYTCYTTACSISRNPDGNNIYISNAGFEMVKSFLPDNTEATKYNSLISGLMVREAIFDFGIIKPSSHIELVELIFDDRTVKCVTKPLTNVEIDKETQGLILRSNVTIGRSN